MLTITDTLPARFLEISAPSIHEILPGPTLIHLPGRRPEPLFVSILLHGNEDVGLEAIQRLLSRHQGRELPRALSIFVGNIEAARQRVRSVPEIPDYNRIWPGAPDVSSHEARMMAEILRRMQSSQVFASVDLHNNTGHNPHYSCVTKLEQPHLQLASLFGPTVVFFRRPLGVQTRAFAEICPAVTCECGKVGDEAGIEHAATFVEACLHLSEIPHRPVPEGDLHLFHTVVTLTIPEALTFGFGNGSFDVNFVAELDRLNFAELPPGTVLGQYRPGIDHPVRAIDEQGRSVAEQYLDVKDGMIRLRRTAMPSMFTCDAEIVRLDCLGYLMERYPLP